MPKLPGASGTGNASQRPAISAAGEKRILAAAQDLARYLFERSEKSIGKVYSTGTVPFVPVPCAALGDWEVILSLNMGTSFAVPENVITHFHLREGDVVSDFGAGSGFFEKALSKMVGKTGKVYVCEIQKVLIERIASMLESEKVDNAEVLWCDIETPDGCKLEDGVLDAGILSNTLFQLDNKQSALKEIRRMLRKGGKFFVLDWSDTARGIGPTDTIPQEKAKALVEQHDFRFVRSFPAGEHHYGLAFQAV